MNHETIARAAKAQLRSLCKQHEIAYGKLTCDGMRAALRKLQPDERAHVADASPTWSRSPSSKRLHPRRRAD